MPVPSQHTDPPSPAQLLALTGDARLEEVAPHVPAEAVTQARALGAFRRARGIATPTALRRARPARALAGLSTRGLGAWAVLVGVADISEAAWRTRPGKSSGWLGWLLGALLTAEVAVTPAVNGRGRRIRPVDATRLARVGGTGDDWRVHLAYDLPTTRVDGAAVSDRHTAAGLGHPHPAPGDVVVGDGGHGYRRRVAAARAGGAEVVLRIDPRACPLVGAAGQPFDVGAWLRRQAGQCAEWAGWCVGMGQRFPVRLIASPLPPAPRGAAPSGRGAA